MRRALFALAASLAASAAPAAPPATTLHSNPVADDNVRLYIVLQTASATLALDAYAPAPLEVPQSVMFTRLSPGPHHATLTSADGASASVDFTLDVTAQAESKGRRWWCLAAGRINGQLTVLHLDSARCKSGAEAGPD